MNPSFILSSDTRFLTQELRKLDVGKEITYDNLGAVISKKINGAFPALTAARKILLRDEGMVFDVIRGIGLKRLDDTAIVQASHRGMKRIRRTAHRESGKLAAVSDFAALSPREQLAYATNRSIYGAIADMASDSGIKKVEKAAHGRADELPIRETLAAFKV